MSRVLLDTSVVIDLPALDLGVYIPAKPLVSAVTVAELSYGLDVDDPVERRARTKRYRAVIDRYLVLAFDTAAADIYGTLAAAIRRAGRDPRPRRLDLQIAATAAAHGIPLLTRDRAAFGGVERLVEVVEL